jgi:hypothetical protein
VPRDGRALHCSSKVASAEFGVVLVAEPVEPLPVVGPAPVFMPVPERSVS